MARTTTARRIEKKGKKKNSDKRKPGAVYIGIISRIDWPLRYSKSLLKASNAIWQNEGIDFGVITGGMTSQRDFNRLVAERVQAVLDSQQKLRRQEIVAGVLKNELTPLENRKEIIARIKEELKETGTRELAEAIPRLYRSDGKQTKIYIINAPSPSYDGELGIEMAHRLHELRSDIVLWANGDGRIPIKYPHRSIQSADDIGFVHAHKALWHNKNDSSSPDRIVEDKEKQTAQSDLPGLWVSGCSGVNYLRPAGELSRAHISPPALNKFEHVESSENQIGVLIVEVEPGPIIQPTVTSVSLRDEIAEARHAIVPASRASERQRAIIEQIKVSPATIGMLEHSLPWSEKAIAQALAEYDRAGFSPKIVKDHVSGRYNFATEFLQHEFEYILPDYNALPKDTLYAFGCLHAGYPWTQYDYFVNEVPKQILEHHVELLVGAGDYIAGLKHSLHERGEVIYGLNYTEQEELAATIICAVLFQVFEKRFIEHLEDTTWNTAVTAKRVSLLVDRSLLEFRYFQGNHDKWQSDLGITPLAHFHSYLEDILARAICGFLARKKIPTDFDVRAIARKHLLFAEHHLLPSGVRLSIRHPEMARTLASSGRAQGTLDYERDSNVVIVANFHTATQIQRWNPVLRERSAIQVGTFAKETDFEKGKNKRCDVGGALVELWSKDGRIKKVRSRFRGPTHDQCVYTDDKTVAYRMFIEKLSESFAPHV